MSDPSYSFASTTAASPHSASGKVRIVAGYALQQKLGSGSFAVVYKGVRTPQATAEHETVAIKAITRSSEKLTKKVLQNLEVEIKILRTYRHPNIVCMHDVQKTDRHFYLILEYCGGGDLQQLIRTRQAGRLSERLTRRLMRDLAAGLKFIWGQELIHRDIKPQNLLLTGPLPLDELNDPEKSEELEMRRRQANYPSNQFALKIADFGFARHLQTSALATTLCGSPLYMPPELLQHQRYDAKADLWSVGTVLFEMVTGRPPFHGENHIDLLRNIQRKAVRLPPDVKVSKECVTLLRILLHRNPLSRAGFKEFFEACDAFVALGCNGVATKDEGTCKHPMLDLGTIPESEGATESESILAMDAAPDLTAHKVPTLTGVTDHPLATAPTPSIPIIAQHNALATAPAPRMGLTPLVPSPPTSNSPLYNPQGLPLMDSRSTTKQSWPQRVVESPREPSSEENSFVMVEHGSSLQKSPSASVAAVASDMQRAPPQAWMDPSPPPSPGYFLNRNPMMTTRGDYLVVKQPKGMLSTSPGTGGALMGMVTGRARLAQGDTSNSRQLEMSIKGATKMLAAAEDVGRRAVSVAHLGDQRAYAAMRLLMMNDSVSSSCLSVSPMEGIEEGVDGQVTDDDRSTEIMGSARRRRSSSATDKSMADVKLVEDTEEMPFVLQSESPPVLSAGIPSRESVSFSRGTSITSPKPFVKPTPAVIRGHFSEALSCYLKALRMLKGAIAAAKKVGQDLEAVSTMRLSTDQLTHSEKMAKRCEVTVSWLSGQFNSVLERGDATNTEIGKLSAQSSATEQTVELVGVEELIYNHSLVHGREGAVKQLLGQYEAARSCYRTAGLLAETLLMESGMGSDDRKVLEDYVDGFAARITELDDVMLEQSRVRSASGSHLSSSRRSQGVVGIIGHQPPFASPAFGLDPNMR